MGQRVSESVSIFVVLGLPALILGTTIYQAVAILVALSDLRADKFITFSDIWFGLTYGVGAPAWQLHQISPSVSRFFGVEITNIGQRAWLGAGIWVVVGVIWFKIGGFIFGAAEAIDRSLAAKK